MSGLDAKIEGVVRGNSNLFSRKTPQGNSNAKGNGGSEKDDIS